MIEPILLGIVVGLIPITLAGLFFAAYMQYRRSKNSPAKVIGINPTTIPNKIGSIMFFAPRALQVKVAIQMFYMCHYLNRY